jgi:hypothetical protein
MDDGLVALLADLEENRPAAGMDSKRGFAELIGLSESERRFVAHAVSETHLPSSYGIKFRKGMEVLMKQIDSTTEYSMARAIWDLALTLFSDTLDPQGACKGIDKRYRNQKIIDLRDYYFPEKVFDIIQKKFVDRVAGVTRSDLPRKVTKFISTTLGKFEADYRRSLGRARSSERLPFSVDGDKREEMLKEIRDYQMGIGRERMDAALAVESLAFDFRNLLSDEFQDERIKTVLTGEKHVDPVRIAGFPCGGLTPFIRSYAVRRDLKSTKERYLKERREEFLDGISLPLALRLYALNMERGLQGVSDGEGSALQILKRVEFEDIIKNNEFGGYVGRLESGEDLFSNVGRRLLDFPEGNGEARVEYLALFRDPANRKRDRIIRYTAGEFTTLWQNAFARGWGFELLGNLDHLDPILDGGQGTSVLASQKSGALIDLLREGDFRAKFISRASENVDYDLLKDLRGLNLGLFRRVYPEIEGEDNQFLTNIVDLVANTNYDFSDIAINNPLKKFLGGIEGYVEEERESLGFILDNFDLVQRALQHGLTPFSGRTSDLEDKVGFSNWISENQEVLGDVVHYENIEPYLNGSKSELLKDSLIGLSRQHGGKVAHACLEKFKGLDVHPLIRVAELLGKSGSPKKLCRKREYIFSLEHLALTLSDHEWARFVGEAENKNGGEDYEALFSDRGSLISERSSMLTNEKVRSGSLRPLYRRFRGTDREGLVDRLMKLRATTLSRRATEGVCRWIGKDQFRLVEEVIEGVEEGKYGNKNVEDIVSNYGTDADLESIPLATYIGGTDLTEDSISSVDSKPEGSWSCNFTPSAQRDFDSLQEGPTKEKLTGQISNITTDPMVGKRLKSHLGGYRSVRAGRHLRVLYEVKPAGRNMGEVLVHRIDHRQRAYMAKI